MTVQKGRNSIYALCALTFQLKYQCTKGVRRVTPFLHEHSYFDLKWSYGLFALSHRYIKRVNSSTSMSNKNKLSHTSDSSCTGAVLVEGWSARSGIALYTATLSVLGWAGAVLVEGWLARSGIAFSTATLSVHGWTGAGLGEGSLARIDIALSLSLSLSLSCATPSLLGWTGDGEIALTTVAVLVDYLAKN